MIKEEWKRIVKRGTVSVLAAALMVSMLPGCSKKEENKTDKTAAGNTANDEKQEKKEKTELHVLAAASLTDAFTEIAEAYQEKAPDIELVFSFESSGTLKTQIEEGAPADVFVSAAMKQMNELAEKGLIEEDTTEKLLENKVVLIKPKDSALELNAFEDVVSDTVGMVAIGNADVPVGQYTETIYQNLGLWEQLTAKANLATNVRQVLDWVATGNVDCGIVYATDAQIEPKVAVVCEAPEGSCDPVIYPSGVVAATAHPDEAKAFQEYLHSEEAGRILTSYGFTMYEE